MVKLLNSDICEFYKRIIDDEKLKNTLGYELEKVSTDNELKILLNKKFYRWLKNGDIALLMKI